MNEYLFKGRCWPGWCSILSLPRRPSRQYALTTYSFYRKATKTNREWILFLLSISSVLRPQSSNSRRKYLWAVAVSHGWWWNYPCIHTLSLLWCKETGENVIHSCFVVICCKIYNVNMNWTFYVANIISYSLNAPCHAIKGAQLQLSMKYIVLRSIRYLRHYNIWVYVMN